MSELRNLVSQAELKKRLETSNEPRITISFYRYHPIEDPAQFRDKLFQTLEALGVLGRIYVAHEGINAQISVPGESLKAFRRYLHSISFLEKVHLNIAVEDDGKSFWVLSIKVRPKIVADGIDDRTFSMQRTGRYLDAAQFNELAEQPDTVVVDMRNYYEYEVGHFENALEVPSDTFRDQLPMSVEMLEADKDKNIVMYCTGGIRCEKASAYLLHHGFQNVYHLQGGIIEYVHQVKARGLKNKFRGLNFVFDLRMAEQVSDEIISFCHQCGEKCATHRNCENDACHLLFLQCEACHRQFAGCCCETCQELKHLTPEQQILSGKRKPEGAESFNKSRSRRAQRFASPRD
ncbi:MAG TPA: rhodanese-related sulfurtransferase [Abditibacteriaceae bacterium]|jgi:UPF0176 protein